jgi:hypothetical protein
VEQAVRGIRAGVANAATTTRLDETERERLGRTGAASPHGYQPGVDDTVLVIAQVAAWRGCFGQP